MIWRNDFPFEKGQYDKLENEIDGYILFLETLEVTPTARRIVVLSNWSINDIVVRSYLDYKYKDIKLNE